jgi:3',5'-cyclic AMP phosphodiesterase CpdA
MLESNLLRDASAAPDLAAEQFQWLRTTLADAKAKPFSHRIAFMHHPLYKKTVGEKDEYENFPTPRRKELLQLFHDAAIEYVFAGHTHQNIHLKDGRMEMITTTNAALGASPKNNPHGVRIVKVYPDRIEQQFYAYEKLPEKIELKEK